MMRVGHVQIDLPQANPERLDVVLKSDRR
jgi:hypothetical protein